MKDIPHIRGKYYIARLIAEGEHEQQDFKYSISDARKIARSISAFANNSGGRLLIGVKDSGVVAGVHNEEDIYVVEAAAQLYCRPAQHLQFKAYSADGGAVVVADIPPCEARPVQAQEPDGTWKSYFRIRDENIAASSLMERAWRFSRKPQGLTVTLNDAEQSVLAFLRKTEHATVEEIMLGASLSRHSAEDIIVRLAALGVICFCHVKSGFEVTVSSD